MLIWLFLSLYIAIVDYEEFALGFRRGFFYVLDCVFR